MDRVQMIKDRLAATLTPESLEVIDESDAHAGHAGAKSGKGHFAVTIVSTQFQGKDSLSRHRMIYAALGNAMDTDIHALSINAYTPDEF